MIIAPTRLRTLEELNTLSTHLQLGIEKVIGEHAHQLFDQHARTQYLHLRWTTQGLVCSFETKKPSTGVHLDVPLAATTQTLEQLARDIQGACSHPFGPQGVPCPQMPWDRALDNAKAVLVQNLLWNQLDAWLDRGFFGLLGRSAQQEHARVTSGARSASPHTQTPGHGTVPVAKATPESARTRSVAQPLTL
jgi:hypothetical protein